MIQYQILQTNITRTIWQTVRRITNEILEVKRLTVAKSSYLMVCFICDCIYLWIVLDQSCVDFVDIFSLSLYCPLSLSLYCFYHLNLGYGFAYDGKQTKNKWTYCCQQNLFKISCYPSGRDQDVICCTILNLNCFSLLKGSCRLAHLYQVCKQESCHVSSMNPFYTSFWLRCYFFTQCQFLSIFFR